MAKKEKKNKLPVWCEYVIWAVHDSPTEPLLIVRMPQSGVPWATILTQMGKVARYYGGKKKGLSIIEGLCDWKDRLLHIEHIWPADKYYERAYNKLRPKIVKAFDGSFKFFPAFQLWDWKKNKFVLARASKS
jgi:hypothetical protein